MNKIIVFRAVSLCVQLASGCASLEQEPMNAEPAPEVVALNIGTPSLPTREIWWHAAPADDTPVSEVHSKSVSDMLALGGYGMLKGAATGALVGLESPFGPLGMIVTVPMGALFGLVGGMASPSMQAVSEWRGVPETNPWPQSDLREKPQRVVVASAPPSPPSPKPVRVQQPRREQHAKAKPQPVQRTSQIPHKPPSSSAQHRSAKKKK